MGTSEATLSLRREFASETQKRRIVLVNSPRKARREENLFS